MNHRRIVVKLGTSTLTSGTPYLSMPRLVDLVRQMSELIQDGAQIVLVTSGAIAAGRELLNFPQLPRQIPGKQMLAAVGQPRLMAVYTQLFGLYSSKVAQVLLTRADLENRRRYLNARNTLQGLLEQGVVPIVNENDTVATEEIRFGDNDNLSAQVAALIDADLLMLLTDQPGLFTADPRQNPAAELVSEVNSDEIPAELWLAAGGSESGLGTGGMITKLQAADLARRSGAAVVIAKGSDADIILRIASEEPVGTRFRAVASALESRKRFLLANRKAAGKLVVDDGAAQALATGSSLLPVGIFQVSGGFERGATVRIFDKSGRELARGMTNYTAEELRLIAGRKSSEIQAVLGYHYGDEVIHRNDMVLV